MTVTPPSRVYIVDDHPLVRESLASLIEKQSGFTICGQAENASLARIGVESAKPDLVIVDLSLRGESGFELMRDIQELSRDSLVVVFTVHDDTFHVERALRAGARGYVTKYESPSKIIEALRTVLAGDVYLSESLARKLAPKTVADPQRHVDLVSDTLTDREFEIFGMIGQGFENRRIADQLQLSLKTVQAHCANIKFKLKLPSGVALTWEAVRWTERRQSADSQARGS